jgi:hypothetical protein
MTSSRTATSIYIAALIRVNNRQFHILLAIRMLFVLTITAIWIRRILQKFKTNRGIFISLQDKKSSEKSGATVPLTLIQLAR